MMSKNVSTARETYRGMNRWTVITLVGVILTILIILATLEISHRHINTFISTQEKYIIGVETAFLSIFIIEMLVRTLTLLAPTPQMMEHGTRLRLIVRILGYSIGSLCVISILAHNATLGISVGAIAGVVIAFAAQNIVGSVLAAVVLLNTRIVRVGEEITISQTKGIVSEINLTHTVLSVDDDVVFVPNSVIVSNTVRRKKRNSNKDASVRNW